MADELWVRWVYLKDGMKGGPYNIFTRETAQAEANGFSHREGYLEVLNTGERFYPQPEKPKPERVGAVAKRVRAEADRPLGDDIERLLACAEASDACEAAVDGWSNHSEFVAWRRTVTGSD